MVATVRSQASGLASTPTWKGAVQISKFRVAGTLKGNVAELRCGQPDLPDFTVLWPSTKENQTGLLQ
jgi:hypothetical protein